MTTIYSSVKPVAIQYMELPNGYADVWLHINIAESEDDEGCKIWTADEVYFRTTLSEEEVEENFDFLFENEGTIIDSVTGEEVSDGVTIVARIDALEEALLELAEVIANG